MILKALWKAVERSGGLKDSARIRRQSQRSVRALKFMQPSGIHDRGGMASEKMLEALGKFERTENALPVLSVNGRILWDASDMPVHIVGLPGIMKTMALGFPMAALWQQSLFAIDVDLEYSRATWRHRREALGNIVHFVIPRGGHGFPSSCWNFFQSVIDAVQAGDIERALSLAGDIAHILVPPRLEGKSSDNEWVEIAARELIVMGLLWLAETKPEECTPCGLYLLLNKPPPEIFRLVGKTSLRSVLQRLINLQAEYAAQATKQVTWKIQKAYESLTLFEPESCYARITSKSDFDPASLKNGKAPQTIYLGVTGEELLGAGVFVSLFLNMMIERIAGASGERATLFLCDEVAQVPKASGVTRGIQTKRKRKQKFVTATQTRHTLGENWGEKARKNIEDMAGTTIWLSPSLEVARELEAKSGTKTVLSHGAKDGDSGHVGKSISEIKAPNLHVAEICYPPEGKAFVEMRGVPGIIVADVVPWWEIYPLSEQIDPGYRDDFYEYDGSPAVSLADARALFGVSGAVSLAELDAREHMLVETFDPILVRAARETLERS